MKHAITKFPLIDSLSWKSIYTITLKSTEYSLQHNISQSPYSFILIKID